MIPRNFPSPRLEPKHEDTSEEYVPSSIYEMTDEEICDYEEECKSALGETDEQICEIYRSLGL